MALLIPILVIILVAMPVALLFFAIGRKDTHKPAKRKKIRIDQNMEKTRKRNKLALRRARRKILGNAPYEELEIQARDRVKLYGEFFPNRSGKLVILIHGYTGSPEEMKDIGAKYYEKGYSLFFPYLRGHGKSGGRFIGMGVLDALDILEWIKWIKENKRVTDVVLHGESMGAATAMMAACKNPDCVRAIVEDSGYTSVYDIFALQMKELFHLPPFPILDIVNLYSKLFAHYSFKRKSPRDAMSKTTIPVLFIHGSADTFVPTTMAYELYENKSGEKELLIVKGARHVYSVQVDPEGYFACLWKFLGKYVESK